MYSFLLRNGLNFIHTNVGNFSLIQTQEKPDVKVFCLIQIFNQIWSELDTSKSHKKSSRKKKKRKHSDTAPESTGSEAPPPLRKRMSRSREGDQNDSVQESEEMKLEKEEDSNEESNKETQSLVEQVAEGLQSGLHLIDTIPEEEEEEDKDKEKQQQQETSDEIKQQSEKRQPTEAVISNSDGAILDKVLEKVLADRQ